MKTAEELQKELDEMTAAKEASDKDAEKWKALSRKNEDDKKANAEKAKLADALQAKLDAAEASKLTDAEKAEKRIADLEAKAAEGEKRVKSAEITALRASIGAELKVPAEFVDRLRGDDEASLRADAETFVKALPAEAAHVWPELGQGQGGGVVADDPTGMLTQLTSILK